MNETADSIDVVKRSAHADAVEGGSGEIVLTNRNPEPTSFTREELREYWVRLHESYLESPDPEDVDFLGAVCYPGAPVWYNRYVADCQLRAFRSVVPDGPSLAGKRILDIGCGTGRWSRLLRDAGGDVLAIDISERAIELDRSRIPGVDFVTGDTTSLDLPQGSFDLVVSIAVLQHLLPDDQELAASKIVKLLRPFGSQLLILENMRDRGPEVFARSIDSWVRLFASRGLAPVYVGGVSFDVPLRFPRRVAERMILHHENGHDARRKSPEEYAIDSLGAWRPGSFRARFNFMLRPLVSLSTVTEPVCSAWLRQDWATHCICLFEPTDERID